MKTTMHSCCTRPAMTALIAVAGIVLPSISRADQQTSPAVTCSAASVAGAYGASLSGVQVTSGGNTPIAVVGRLTADGHGNITSLSGTASLGGIVLTATGSGTYTVGANCTGTASINTNIIPTVHISFTLITSGTRALAIGTDSTYVITGELDKQ